MWLEIMNFSWNRRRMPDTVDEYLQKSNERLKAGRVGVAIERKRDRLYLRATLPPKPNSSQTKPHQQRIGLGLYANLTGIKQSEAEAKKLGALLACREFVWEPYLKEKPADTVAEWVAKFETDYFIRRRRDDKSLTTWNGDYLKVFRRLPEDAPLTPELMRQAIIATEPDTKTRRRVCMVLNALARFADINIDVKPLAGRYSPLRVQPRQLPDDETILSWFYKIKNPAWRWVYGMLATYGLRNHEVFRLNFESLKETSPVIEVLQGKTGDRRIWACYPEWVEDFQLLNVQLPPIRLDRSNSAIGSSCGHYFKTQVALPFPLYSLRHCWAIRTLEFGLDITLAAQQMGHSVAVHSDLYHRWISDRHHQKAFETLMMRENRPKPPILKGK